MNLIKPAATTAVLLALTLTAAPAAATPPDPKVDEWHTWLVDEVYTDHPKGADDVSWPQKHLGAGKLIPDCGWAQQDRYVAKRSQVDAVLADGKLTYGEDFRIVKEWRYVYGGPCSTPTPTATPTPTPTPTETSTPTPTPTSIPEPSTTPTPTVTPTPTPSDTPSSTPTPTSSTTPGPQPSASEGVGTTPQYTERATPTAEVAGHRVLAATGAPLLAAPIVIGAIVASAIGAALIRRKRDQQ